MPIRVADGNGVVTSDAVISAFDYAALKGARVVNASFTSDGFSQALLDAIRRNPRVLVVAAAGNGGDDGVSDDNDTSPQYPCDYPAPNLICVGASDRNDRLASFSNYGRLSVDLVAPGSSILSTAPAYSAPLFSEGFETDMAGRWATGGTNNSWARITTVAHGGSYSLSDSPGTAYLDNTDSFVRTLTPFSLSGRTGCRLEYALRLATEFGSDKLSVEVSRDGVSWSTVSEFSGSTEGAFLELSDDLSELDGQGALYLRYHLTSNASVTADGAQLDDVAVRCLSSTFTGQELAFHEGTSMSAPHVSGTAALILSKYPALGASGVREAIMGGADRKPALAGKTVTGGRLNANRALARAVRLVPSVELRASSRQRGAEKRGITVFARCVETCALTATGRVLVAGSSKVLGLRKVARSLPARKRAKLVLKLSGPAAAAARRALARHKPVSATVTATATDRRGNSARASRTIRLGR
jgi:subtilisin family serine protease